MIASPCRDLQNSSSSIRSENTRTYDARRA
jgi:hypothetical protein